MSEQEHIFREGFMVMMYECEDCNQVEHIWNSRNGVTPFMIGCRECKGHMSHIQWGKDSFNPNYKPHPHDRVFVDMSQEHANDFARRDYMRFRAGGHIKAEVTEEMFVPEQAQNYFKNGHSPYCVRADLTDLKLGG